MHRRSQTAFILSEPLPPPPALVPGRECGECTYCCQYLTVDTEEIQVEAGILCRHCVDKKGCTIYETRPQVCRTHFCGWRLSALFDDSWRPDRIGILMTPVDKNIPADYMQEGLELLLVHPEIALARPDFYQLIFRAVANRIPLFITLCGPPGHANAGVFINTILEDPVQRKNEKDFKGILDALVKTIAARPFHKVALKHGKQS